VFINKKITTAFKKSLIFITDCLILKIIFTIKELSLFSLKILIKINVLIP